MSLFLLYMSYCGNNNRLNSKKFELYVISETYMEIPSNALKNSCQLSDLLLFRFTDENLHINSSFCRTRWFYVLILSIY